MFCLPHSLSLKRLRGMGSKMSSLVALTRAAAPYLAIELLLPGGSVIAFVTWLYRHRPKA